MKFSKSFLRAKAAARLKYSMPKKPTFEYTTASNGRYVKHGTSLLENRTLDALGIKVRSKVIIVFGKTYVVDGFIPETNTIIEINGSYWHGDLRVYKPNGYNVQCKKTFAQLNYETRAKYQLWKDCGYRVLYAWEKDLNAGNIILREFKNINDPL